MPLTEVAIKSLKPQVKEIKVSDAGGLYLLIHPNGGKYWRLKYRYAGKEKKLSIGTYPMVSLHIGPRSVGWFDTAIDAWMEECIKHQENAATR